MVSSWSIYKSINISFTSSIWGMLERPKYSRLSIVMHLYGRVIHCVLHWYDCVRSMRRPDQDTESDTPAIFILSTVVSREASIKVRGNVAALRILSSIGSTNREFIAATYSKLLSTIWCFQTEEHRCRKKMLNEWYRSNSRIFRPKVETYLKGTNFRVY